MREVYDSEVSLTDAVFKAIGAAFGKDYTIDFADSGNEIFVRNCKTNESFTVTVKQDK